MNMSDRYQELLRRPDLRREHERETLYEGAISNICGLLNARGLTQAELAKRLGVSPGRVSHILSGRRNLTLKTLADLAWALGLRAELRLEAIEDLASTPAREDRPIIPSWLRRQSERRGPAAGPAASVARDQAVWRPESWGPAPPPSGKTAGGSIPIGSFRGGNQSAATAA